MKIKKIKNLPFKENTHHTFFNEKNSPKNIDSFLNFPELSNYGITSIQKTQTGQLSSYNKHSSLLTSISEPACRRASSYSYSAFDMAR